MRCRPRPINATGSLAACTGAGAARAEAGWRHKPPLRRQRSWIGRGSKLAANRLAIKAPNTRAVGAMPSIDLQGQRLRGENQPGPTIGRVEQEIGEPHAQQRKVGRIRWIRQRMGQQNRRRAGTLYGSAAASSPRREPASAQPSAYRTECVGQHEHHRRVDEENVAQRADVAPGAQLPDPKVLKIRMSPGAAMPARLDKKGQRRAGAIARGQGQVEILVDIAEIEPVAGRGGHQAREER